MLWWIVGLLVVCVCLLVWILVEIIPVANYINDKAVRAQLKRMDRLFEDSSAK